MIESDFDACDLAHKIRHFFGITACAGIDNARAINLRQKVTQKVELTFTSGVEKTSSVRLGRLKPVMMRSACASPSRRMMSSCTRGVAVAVRASVTGALNWPRASAMCR